MPQEHLETRNRGLIKRGEAITPEFPNSSTEIFREAVAHIPALEYGSQTTYATVGVASYMVEVNPEAAETLVSKLRDQIIEIFPPERTKARCLMNILDLELDHSWQGSTKTLDELIQTILVGVPPEKAEGYLVDTIQAVARRSANSARNLVKERFPYWEDEDIQLHIAEQQAKYDAEGAGKAASEYLTRRLDFWKDRPQWDPEKEESRLMPTPRHPDSKEYFAQKFGWLVARYGDIDLADRMSEVLKDQDPSKLAILGEIAAREPETKRGQRYTEQARRLLELEEVWVEHYKRLAEVFTKSNPELANLFMQKVNEADYFDVGIPTVEVPDILATGNFIEASRIVGTVIKADSANPVMVYPSMGPKHELEKFMVEAAKTNPQRVVALIDDNFNRPEKSSDAHLIGFKTDVLVEGAKGLIEAGQVQQAKDFLARAVVLARSMKTTRESYNEEFKGQKLAKQDEVADIALMKIKAWTLAKVGAAVAKLEEHSAGL